jgi:hypothetical protein
MSISPPRPPAFVFPEFIEMYPLFPFEETPEKMSIDPLAPTLPLSDEKMLTSPLEVLAPMPDPMMIAPPVADADGPP